MYDTSIWIDIFKKRKESNFSDVVLHELVIAELFIGGMSIDYSKLFSDLYVLKADPVEKILEFVQHNRLISSGIGWIDACLLCSAVESHCKIRTLDQGLANVARKLQILAE